jgi:SAM-dependent methyltransferase
MLFLGNWVMDETSKSKRIWGPLEWSVLRGTGIDIGCGPDPVTSEVRKFDVEDGDANEITKYVREIFDFVYASHCLEHMHQPKEALLEWWKLMKPGGHIFFIVPDEDLYEQGIFPSRFNPDHKATFTVSKRESWSPVSLNVLDLALSLPDSQLVNLQLQDHGYDRGELRFGRQAKFFYRVVRRLEREFRERFGRTSAWVEGYLMNGQPDQTRKPGVLAQIQCIVKKVK